MVYFSETKLYCLTGTLILGMKEFKVRAEPLCSTHEAKIKLMNSKKLEPQCITLHPFRTQIVVMKEFIVINHIEEFKS